MAADPARRAAFVALPITVLIWALSWIVMKQALRWIGPFDFAALRYLLGSAVLFAALALTRQPLRPPPWLPTLAVGLCQTAAFQGLGQWALLDGGAGRVALLSYTMPFWAVLLAWPILGERPGRRQVTGLLFAGAGLLCILEPWHGFGQAHSTVIALAGGVAWALGTVLSKRLLRRASVPVLTFTAWQMLAGALVLAAFACWVPQRPPQWGLPLFGALLYSGVLASSVAWALWLVVLRHLPTTVASLGSLGVPVTGVLLAWLLLGEQPDAWEGLGIALILAGLAAVSGVSLARPRA